MGGGGPEPRGANLALTVRVAKTMRNCMGRRQVGMGGGGLNPVGPVPCALHIYLYRLGRHKYLKTQLQNMLKPKA